MKVENYVINFEVMECRSVSYTFNHDLQQVDVLLPENLSHDAYVPFFKRAIQRLLDGQDLIMNCASRVIRHRNSNKVFQSAAKILSRLEKEHGDLEAYKDCWDYNKAPVKQEGKYGDLKAFLEMRQGGKLNLGGK